MKKKSFIAQEAAAPYTANKLAKARAGRQAVVSPKKKSDAPFQQVAAKIFAERKELLHKLAQ